MSNTIYSIQEKLDSILDIEQTEYETTDKELFDCSDSLNGGKGHGYFSWTGKTHTEETKQYMSKSHKGMKHTEETKRKISEAKKGQMPWNTGTKGRYSEEYKRKLSEAKKGIKRTEEAKRAISEGQRGRIVTEETRRKISETMKKTLQRKQND